MAVQVPDLQVAVCHDPEVASALIGQGAPVVLYGDGVVELAGAVISLRDAGGRVAALIGDPGDADVEAAALDMARELFGGEPVVVHTMSEARQRTRSGTVDPHPNL